MPMLFEWPHLVRPDEIDPMGHANNIAYLHWLQAAAIAHSTAQGWSPDAYRERSWAWVVRRHAVEYRRPAFAGDAILVRTWVADFQRFTSLRKYEVRSGSQLLARAETNWAFVDTAAQQLRPVPVEVSSAFEVWSAAQANGTAEAGR